MTNPNHEPAGSSIGGQFAEGKGNAEINARIKSSSKYTAKQMSVLKKYTLNDYKGLNTDLRQQARFRTLEEEKAFMNKIKTIDSMMESSDKSMDLYKGASLSDEDLAKIVEGGEYKDFAYMSTSSDLDIAKDFMTIEHTTKSYNPVLFEIFAPKGTPMVQVPNFNGSGFEAEFLLNRSMSFNIVSVIESETNPRFTTVQLEVVK